jgi:hypothetical protein
MWYINSNSVRSCAFVFCWICESAAALAKSVCREQTEYEAIIQGSFRRPRSNAEEKDNPQRVETAVYSE